METPLQWEKKSVLLTCLLFFFNTNFCLSQDIYATTHSKNYTEIIEYSPRGNSEGCHYTLKLEATVSISGLSIDVRWAAPIIVNVKAITYRGKTYYPQDLPASVFSLYTNTKLNENNFDFDIYNLKNQQTGAIPWNILFTQTYLEGEAARKKNYERALKLLQENSLRPENIRICNVCGITFNSTIIADYFIKKGKAQTDGSGKTNNSSNSSSGVTSSKFTAQTSTTSQGLKPQETANSDFWNDKPNSQNKTQAAEKPKQPTANEINAAVKKQNDDFWSEKKESDTRIEQQTTNRIKNINDASAVREARNDLNESTSLTKTYATVEKLMGDFNYKMSQINKQINTLTENNKAEFNSRVDNSFSDPKDAGFAAGIKIIGSIVNDAKEKKEREYYKEKLEKEKNAKLKEITNTKRLMLTKVRQQLFSEFKEGILPSSSSSLKATTIFYFTYAYEPANLSSESPKLYVSNIFPISQYSDATWPFKSGIMSEVSNLTPYEEKLCGYYLSDTEAKAMLTGITDIFKKTGGTIETFTYKGKPSYSTSTKNGGDFWGNDKKAKPLEGNTTTPKKDDFWKN